MPRGRPCAIVGPASSRTSDDDRLAHLRVAAAPAAIALLQRRSAVWEPSSVSERHFQRKLTSWDVELPARSVADHVGLGPADASCGLKWWGDSWGRPDWGGDGCLAGRCRYRGHGGLRRGDGPPGSRWLRQGGQRRGGRRRRRIDTEGSIRDVRPPHPPPDEGRYHHQRKEGNAELDVGGEWSVSLCGETQEDPDVFQHTPDDYPVADSRPCFVGPSTHAIPEHDNRDDPASAAGKDYGPRLALPQGLQPDEQEDEKNTDSLVDVSLPFGSVPPYFSNENTPGSTWK